MMKVECKIKRNGGTDVELPPDTIKFRPIDATRVDSPHVADVDEEHAARLFAADAKVYTPFNASAKREPLAAPRTPAEVPLYGSNYLPAVIEIAAGKTATLGDLVREAFKASGLFPDQWNALTEQDRDGRLHALIDAARALHQPKPDATATAEQTTASTAAETGTATAAAVVEHPKDKPADTNGDGSISVRELKKGIADGTLDSERLRELMAEEEKSLEPRQSFIAEIVKALK